MITEAIIASVIAGSSVCSDHFENTSRFNPSDLSDYSKCVTIVHDMDHGTVGNYLWIRSGEGADSVFTYVNTRDLQNKTKDSAIDLVTGKVVNSVIVDQLEAEIVVLEGEIETLTEELDAADMEVTRLTSELSAMTAARDALQATIDGEPARVAAAVSAAVAPLNAKVMTLTADLSAAETARMAAETARDMAQGRLAAIATYKAQVAMSSFTVPTTGTNYDTTAVRAGNYNPAEGKGTVTSYTGTNHANYGEYDDSGDLFGYVEAAPGTPPGTTYYVAGVNVSQDAYNSILNAVNGALQGAYDSGWYAGYAAGYDDGYQDGYAEGYKDGFKDGVASVQ